MLRTIFETPETLGFALLAAADSETAMISGIISSAKPRNQTSTSSPGCTFSKL
jgi:hypothetical protein